MPISLLVAWRALHQNRLQTMLTLIGMSVGVAMVVVVAGLGGGAQARIEAQLESAGPTLVTVRAGNYTPAAIAASGDQDSSGGEPSEGAQDVLDEPAPARKPVPRGPRRQRSPAPPLTEAELRLLERDVAHVRAVSASVAGNVRVDGGGSSSPRIVRVQGFGAAWPEMQSWRLVAGRLPTSAEHDAGAPVAVLTRAAATRVFGGDAAIGRTLPVAGQTITVVGVLEDDPAPRSVVVPPVDVPVRCAQRLLGRATFDAFAVRSTSVAATTTVANDIRSKLRTLRQLPADTLDDFRVETQSVAAMPLGGGDPRRARAVHANAVAFEQASYEEMARSMRQAGRTLAWLLAGAAAVSLVVGGIGVMNIMLVSVAARTREIGLRLAMGARAGDVLAQFLAEAVSLAALGGLLGLGLGTAGLAFAEHRLHWATSVSPLVFMVAILLAAATGIAFGLGPARRAAALDPVVALRAE